MNRVLTAPRQAAALLLCLFFARPASADDSWRYDPWRFGVVPSIGAGAAVLTNSGPTLPSFIGYTDLGLEVLAEVVPWGGFLRGDFLSSGPDGRWTAESFALGASRRFFGDPEHFTLVGRAGLVFERWHGAAVNEGCDISLFVPSNCKSIAPPPQPGVITAAAPIIDVFGDSVGVMGSARLELPIPPAYLALDASFVPVVAVDSPSPGGVFQLRLNLELGFRDNRPINAPPRPPEDTPMRGHYQ
jgi:hypothetical protein